LLTAIQDGVDPVFELYRETFRVNDDLYAGR